MENKGVCDYANCYSEEGEEELIDMLVWACLGTVCQPYATLHITTDNAYCNPWQTPFCTIWMGDRVDIYWNSLEQDKPEWKSWTDCNGYHVLQHELALAYQTSNYPCP